jgi:hypothetical protein
MIGLITMARIKTVAMVHHDFVLSLSSIKFASGFNFPQIKNNRVANTNKPIIKRIIKVTSLFAENCAKFILFRV